MIDLAVTVDHLKASLCANNRLALLVYGETNGKCDIYACAFIRNSTSVVVKFTNLLVVLTLDVPDGPGIVADWRVIPLKSKAYTVVSKDLPNDQVLSVGTGFVGIRKRSPVPGPQLY